MGVGLYDRLSLPVCGALPFANQKLVLSALSLPQKPSSLVAVPTGRIVEIFILYSAQRVK